MTAPVPSFDLTITEQAGTFSHQELRSGFRTGYMLQIVDKRTNTTRFAHVFALAPTGHEMNEAFTVTLTPTDGDSVVAEENGIIISEINITGTFGYSRKRPPIHVAGISNDRRLGNEHFIRLRNLFRTYSELKKDPATGHHFMMTFHSMRDDDHFVVVPQSFDTPRNQQTRVHYQYRIRMSVVGRIEVSKLKTPSEGSVLQTISEALNDARAYYSDLTADAADARRKIANFQAIVIQAGAVITAVSNFVKGTTSRILYPVDQFASGIEEISFASQTIAATAGQTADAPLLAYSRTLQRMSVAFDRIKAFPDQFEENSPLLQARLSYRGEQGLTPTDIENSSAGATPGSQRRIAQGSASSNGFPSSEFSALEQVHILNTDTIDSIAFRYNTTPEELALINSLSPPYIIPGGGPGVKKPGDTLFVPVQGSADEDALRKSLPSEEAIYGRDLAIDMKLLKEEGIIDLMEDVVHGGTDAVMTAGLPNVIQGIQIILHQERGSVAYVPDVGISRTVGVRGTLQTVLLASVNLRQAILQDPRVQDIADVQVVLDGDVLTQEITPILIGRRNAATLVLPIANVGD